MSKSGPLSLIVAIRPSTVSRQLAQVVNHPLTPHPSLLTR